MVSIIDVQTALLLTILGAIAASSVVYILVFNVSYSAKTPVNQRNDSVVVFVTAHPDDECMFFGPTIIQTCRRNAKNVHLLCLTTGNLYQKGPVRQKELHKSNQILGIPTNNVHILDNSSFLDGSREWDFHVLIPELLEFLRRVKPDYIFTFDDYGVSGHTNHIATSDAVRQMYQDFQSKGIKMPAIFQLESVPIYRKYLSILDIPLSLLSSRLYFTSSPSDVFRAQKAMYAHRSQLVWFRWLYIIFSRYMLINTFKEVTLGSPSDSS